MPMAGKSTLDRLELAKAGADADSPYCKIVADLDGMANLLIDVFLDTHPEPLEEITLDIDPTDLGLFGEQLGRHFQKYYDDYCYLPLYVFCGEVVKKPWDRLLACHFPHIIDRLEAYPTNKITASVSFCWSSRCDRATSVRCLEQCRCCKRSPRESASVGRVSCLRQTLTWRESTTCTTNASFSAMTGKMGSTTLPSNSLRNGRGITVRAHRFIL
jgi:hypothetical protein